MNIDKHMANLVGNPIPDLPKNILVFWYKRRSILKDHNSNSPKQSLYISKTKTMFGYKICSLSSFLGAKSKATYSKSAITFLMA